MTKDDHKFFPSDVRKYDWDQYRYNYHLGLLRYVGKETVADVEVARKRLFKFRVAHFVVLIFYYMMWAAFYFYLGRLFGINRAIESWLSDPQ